MNLHKSTKPQYTNDQQHQKLGNHPATRRKIIFNINNIFSYSIMLLYIIVFTCTTIILTKLIYNITEIHIVITLFSLCCTVGLIFCSFMWCISSVNYKQHLKFFILLSILLTIITISFGVKNGLMDKEYALSILQHTKTPIEKIINYNNTDN